MVGGGCINPRKGESFAPAQTLDSGTQQVCGSRWVKLCAWEMETGVGAGGLRGREEPEDVPGSSLLQTCLRLIHQLIPDSVLSQVPTGACSDG